MRVGARRAPPRRDGGLHAAWSGAQSASTVASCRSIRRAQHEPAGHGSRGQGQRRASWRRERASPSRGVSSRSRCAASRGARRRRRDGGAPRASPCGESRRCAAIEVRRSFASAKRALAIRHDRPPARLLDPARRHVAVVALRRLLRVERDEVLEEVEPPVLLLESKLTLRELPLEEVAHAPALRGACRGGRERAAGGLRVNTGRHRRNGATSRVANASLQHTQEKWNVFTAQV